MPGSIASNGLADGTGDRGAVKETLQQYSIDLKRRIAEEAFAVAGVFRS
jgi:hypothetical protein